MVAGFPLKGILGQGLKISSGTVSSLSGLDDDARFLQVSAPVQLGNSGSPLLDENATVIGVVDYKLNAIWAVQKTGDIPQNVNFAIKGVIVRGFLDIHGIDYQIIHAPKALPTSKIAASARKFTVPVECWK